MKVDCYNATECYVQDICVGDTFYLDRQLHIKVAVDDVDVFTTQQERCFVVELSRGVLKSVKADTPVILANTKVVAVD